MFEVLLLGFGGVVGGVATGLVPGIHPNALAAFVLTLSPLLLSVFSPAAVIVFMITMAVSHTLVSFIPSVFLGMPEGETALSVLPGHRYLLEGRGYEAVHLTVVGGIGVIMLSVLLLPLLMIALPFLYAQVRSYLGVVLAGITLIMIFSEQGWGKAKGALVFLLAGLLGVLSLSPTFSSLHILFPLLTGLFGMSTLLVSTVTGVELPPQTTSVPSTMRRTSLSGVVKGFFSGMVVGILPGIGPSQAGVLVHQLTRGKGLQEFLIALGGINTVAALFSLLSLYLINKPRSGVAVAIQQVIGGMGLHEVALLVASAVFATGVAALTTLKITVGFARLIQQVNYRTLLVMIMVFLVVMTALLTGGYGLLILTAATGIGLLPPLWNVKRTHGMGCLMVVVIFFYLPI